MNEITECQKCSFFVRLRRPVRGHLYQYAIGKKVVKRAPYTKGKNEDDTIAVCICKATLESSKNSGDSMLYYFLTNLDIEIKTCGRYHEKPKSD